MDRASDTDDEYRFHPEDFEGDGEDAPTSTEADQAPALIVGFLGVGVGLFLADPFFDPVGILGIQVALSAIAAIVFAIGLAIGGGSYVRQGRPRLGAVHAVGALGWVVLAAGMVASSTPVIVGGGAILVASSTALVALVWGAAS
jgi:hypothetical protein